MKLLIPLTCFFIFSVQSFASDTDYIRRNEFIPPTELNRSTEIRGISLRFNGSTAVDLCLDKKANLLVEGSLWKYRVKRSQKINFSQYVLYSYSNIPTKNVLLGCKNHNFTVKLYKKVPVLNSNGEVIKYELMPQDTNVEIGTVDTNCHLTIDPRVDILKPDLRLFVQVENLHNSRSGYGDNLSYSMSFDCSLINQY